MSEIIVELTAKCDRTGKTEKLPMSTDEAETFGKHRDVKSQTAATLLKELGSLSEGQMPDLIVAYKGKLVIRANVNPKSDDALARLLHEVTRDGDVFPKPATKKRKGTMGGVEEAEEIPFVSQTASGAQAS